MLDLRDKASFMEVTEYGKRHMDLNHNKAHDDTDQKYKFSQCTLGCRLLTLKYVKPVEATLPSLEGNLYEGHTKCQNTASNFSCLYCHYKDIITIT